MMGKKGEQVQMIWLLGSEGKGCSKGLRQETHPLFLSHKHPRRALDSRAR